jgi:hypothetical protein
MRFLGLALLALVLVAGLALAAEPQTGTAGDYTVTLTTNPSPPVVGDNELTVTVMKDGKPVAGAGVALHLDMTEMAMPSDVEAKAGANKGEYLARVNLGMAGEWKVTAKVQQMAGMDMAGDGEAQFTLMVPAAGGVVPVTMPGNIPPAAPVQGSAGSSWLVIGLVIVALVVVIVIVRSVLRAKG